MIQIFNVKMQNFMSYPEYSLSFQNQRGQAVLITGMNNQDGFDSNGAGKSAIYEGIVWVLYGKTVRGLSEAGVIGEFDHVVSGEVTGKVGELEFVINRARDSRGKRSLNFTIGGKNAVSAEKITPSLTQKTLDSIFGDFITFTNATMFGQQAKAFINTTPTERRKLLSDILEFTVFDLARKIVKSKIDAITPEIETMSAEAKGIRAGLGGAVDHSEPIRKQLENLVSDICTAYGCPPEDLQKSIDLYQMMKQETENALRVYQAALNDHNNKVYALNSSCEKYSRLIMAGSSVCPECETPLNMDDLFEKRSNLQAEVKILEDAKPISPDLKISYSEITNKISGMQNSVRQMESYQRMLQQQENIQAAELERTRRNIIRLSELSQSIAKKNVEFEALQPWLKIFGTSIKDMLLKTLAPIITHKTNEILKVFVEEFFQVEMQKGVDGLNYEITKNGIKVDEKCLSPGEQGRINVAFAIGLQQAISDIGSRSFNIRFYDEIFEALDSTGIERIIRSRLFNIPGVEVLLISHIPNIQDYFNSVITARKTNGRSELI